MEGFKNIISILTSILKISRNNFPEVLSIPTFLGGLWQFIGLMRVGIPYGRFFSVSQLIADGLLTLLLIAVLFAVTTAMIVFLDYINEYKLKITLKNKSDFFQIFIFIIICQSVITAGIIVFLFFYRPLPNITVLGIVFLSLLISSIIFVTITFYVEKYIEKKKKSKKQPKLKVQENNKEKEESEILKERLKEFIVYFSIGSLVIISLFYLANKFFLIPNDLENMKRVSCLIDNDFPNKKDREVIYYNDKYIFVEVLTSKEEKIIQVYEYKELFNSNACKKEKINSNTPKETYCF